MNQEFSKHNEESGSPESREKAPNFKIEIYFGIHGTAEDMEGDDGTNSPGRFKRRGLRESFESADIYVPELHGWNETALQKMQDLSYGRISPDDFIKEAGLNKRDPMFGFKKAQLEMIHKSFKPIIILDVPEDDPRSEAMSNHYLGPKEKARPSNFNQALASIKENLRQAADLHNEREDYMISQLVPRLEEAFKIRPDLRNRSDLKVLMFLGIAHTRVAHQLAEYGLTINTKYSRLPFIFSYDIEAQRRLALGKEVDNELAAKVLLEQLCRYVIGPIATRLTNENNEVIAFIRKIVSLFTYEEIKHLYSLGIPSAFSEFFKYMEEKKIYPPRDHSELISFISGSNSS
ncbi:MAG TPA: hypothetical protein VJJ72_00765 [Candidatus Paceibacterota bacterium]